MILFISELISLGYSLDIKVNNHIKY
jgi:hypothetical protein